MQMSSIVRQVLSIIGSLERPFIWKSNRKPIESGGIEPGRPPNDIGNLIFPSN